MTTATADESTEYLLPGQVAAILRVSPKTVTRWAKEGKLSAQRTLGGHRRYPAAEIQTLAAELNAPIPA